MTCMNISLFNNLHQKSLHSISFVGVVQMKNFDNIRHLWTSWIKKTNKRSWILYRLNSFITIISTDKFGNGKDNEYGRIIWISFFREEFFSTGWLSIIWSIGSRTFQIYQCLIKSKFIDRICTFKRKQL